MTINQVRSILYRTAKALGDVQAVSQASKKKSMRPIGKRIARRLVGKLTGRAIGALFRGK